MIWLMPALAGTCAKTTIAEVTSISAPAVLVLGERMGTSPDLRRARKVVWKLSMKAPVTLGLQVVQVNKQPVLDRYGKGELPIVLLENDLGWSGFPFGAYERLFTLGVPIIGLGVPPEPKPVDQPIPLPPGYGRLLADGMSGHTMPADLEGDFVQMVSWIDHRVAARAIEAWDGTGYLVIIADRAHVEGAKGVSWQAQRLTEAPVYTVLLAGPGACYSGDRYL